MLLGHVRMSIKNVFDKTIDPQYDPCFKKVNKIKDRKGNLTIKHHMLSTQEIEIIYKQCWAWEFI